MDGMSMNLNSMNGMHGTMGVTIDGKRTNSKEVTALTGTNNSHESSGCCSPSREELQCYGRGCASAGLVTAGIGLGLIVGLSTALPGWVTCLSGGCLTTLGVGTIFGSMKKDD